MTKIIRFFVALLLFPGVILLTPIPATVTAVAADPSANDRGSFPAPIVKLGASYAVVVDKSQQQLHVFHHNGRGMELIFTAPCSTGMNGGSKEAAGDGKTPEGIYFATDRFSERELSATYGALAFNLNYPNFVDSRKGRTGCNIWIHGTDTDLSPFQSNGCVVLADGNIRRLAEFIELNKTPVIILNRVQWVSGDAALMARRELTALVDRWLEQFRAGHIDELASMYENRTLVDDESLKKIVEKIEDWKSRGIEASFNIENVSILKHEGHAAVIFDQVVSYRDRSWSCGHRVLFLGRNGKDWIISGDVLQHPSSADQLGEQLAIMDAMISIYADVSDMIERWRVSWQSGDMRQYASFYARDFRSNGMDRAGWIAYKKRIGSKNKNITITIGDLEITPGSKRSRVSFHQLYQSSIHSDEGIKTLYLKKDDGRWKICRETWKAS
ncbi:MAG: hypothetical protein AVO39_06715 [delta proteobacterium MLS_D]|jgi:murein L,D-transpeptidase YafK|nr:MAG: hypothetical protein AVO39_06715 [delta proteobacterium MLS_D]